MSQTSSTENEQTIAPLLGAISTSPSASSIVSAWRTGVRLTPSRSASCSSIRRSFGTVFALDDQTPNPLEDPQRPGPVVAPS